MGADVSAIVVTYNSRRVIGAMLSSLREHTRGVQYEVTVVDNASADGTPDLVEREYPWVRVVRRGNNGGLARGINDGALVSTGHHLALLNPDLRFDSDALTTLSAALDRMPDAGIVAPKLLDDDGALQLSCRAFPGYGTALFNRYSLLTRIFPSNRYSRAYLLQDFDHDSARDVDWVSGAALMTPSAVFERLEGWDCGFFMFSEDVDYCRRVHDAGLRVVYEPAAHVYHTIGVSKTPSPRMIVSRHRSMWRYYRKHMRGNALRDAATGAGIAARGGVMLAAWGAGRVARTVRSRG